MIERTITIGDRAVAFKSSAAVPRIYRAKFGRDIFRDFSNLEQSFGKSSAGESSLSVGDLEVFENIAYVMAYHADPSIPANIDEWLEQFEMFSIYTVLPELIDLWGTNMQTESVSKKNKTTRARGK